MVIFMGFDQGMVMQLSTLILITTKRRIGGGNPRHLLANIDHGSHSQRSPKRIQKGRACEHSTKFFFSGGEHAPVGCTPTRMGALLEATLLVHRAWFPSQIAMSLSHSICKYFFSFFSFAVGDQTTMLRCDGSSCE